MPEKILWATVGGFLSGVFIASFFSVGYTLALFFLLLGLVAAFFVFLLPQKRESLIVFTLACIALSCGIARMHMSNRVGDPILSSHVGTTVTVSGMVSEEPDVRDNNVRLTVDVERFGTSTPVRARVIVAAPLHSDARYGDAVTVKGELEAPQPFDTTLGRQFDYPKYLAKDDILYTLSFAQVETTGERGGNIVKKGAIRIKRVFLSGLGNALPEPEAGLAGGITVGDKRSIGAELSADFQKVSLIHMVVLSGYNITVVVNAVTALLGSFAETVRFGAAGLVITLFILMAGGAASAMRAGAMALIAIFARMTHRTFIAERALGVVALVMVLWNPWTLCFDPSFQLSVLATLGLIRFTPLFELWLSRVPERWGLREILASTLGTQTMVLPFLLYQNGNLSLVALPANVFALVTVPFAMAASVFAAFAGLLAGPLAPVFGLPAYLLLGYEIFVARFFAALPFASVGIPAFSALLMFVLYAALFGAYALYIKKTAPPGGGAV